MEETQVRLLNGSKSMEFKMKHVVCSRQEDGQMVFNVLTSFPVETVEIPAGLFTTTTSMKLKLGAEFEEKKQ